MDSDGFYDFKVYIRLLILEIKLLLFPCLPKTKLKKFATGQANTSSSEFRSAASVSEQSFNSENASSKKELPLEKLGQKYIETEEVNLETVEDEPYPKVRDPDSFFSDTAFMDDIRDASRLELVKYYINVNE